MTNSPGARIKYLRLLADMSQEELGKRVGVQRAAINKYEKGSVTNIPISTIEKIAQIFDVSPNYIVGWDNVDSNPLSAEVKILQGVKKFYGGDAVELIESYVQLNSIGKRRVFQYVDDMHRLYGEDEPLAYIELYDNPEVIINKAYKD
jgi:transcriptional regulator with XRE-family HTH domain